MSGAPWMKFYPADWRADQALRVCSLAARGLWIEMLCVMHNAIPYGHLLINGSPVSDTQLAMLAGTPSEQISALVGELESAGVFSRTGKGVIYSRRMTRDEKKAALARKYGQQGGNPNLCNKTVNPPPDNPNHKPHVNGPDNTQKPEAKKESPPNPPAGGKGGGDFFHFWTAYPSRGGAPNSEKPARELFAALVASGVDPAVIIGGARGYAAWAQKAGKDGTDKVMQASRFLHDQVYAEYSKPRAVPDSGIDPRWRNRIAHFRATGEWDHGWGPRPGAENCEAPADLVAEFRKEGAA
jgi:hypothetical protein